MSVTGEIKKVNLQSFKKLHSVPVGLYKDGAPTTQRGFPSKSEFMAGQIAQNEDNLSLSW